MVFIDFAKVFDTVSHLHIWEVLERRGVDEHIKGLIRDSYKECKTVIRTEAGETEQIMLKKGVKQGDPMSPILFNMAIDLLLYTLEKHQRDHRLHLWPLQMT